MPVFGEFETAEPEPFASTEQNGHRAVVWKARRPGGQRDYAIKQYLPPRRVLQPGEPDTTHLHKDRGLKFLEGIKQAAKAAAEGGRCLAPIHGLGTAEAGVWYATDFYPRHHLGSYIERHGKVNGPSLRHILAEVVDGCLALQRSRGYSHGNLKTTNIFLAGKPRLLRKTPLRLTDPYPAALLQLAAEDAVDQSQEEETLPQRVEVQDLHALGELILQLVESRLFLRPDD